MKLKNNLLMCVPIKGVDPIRVVIIGQAGHGKSRLTNYLLYSIFYTDWKDSNFLFFNDCLDQFHSIMLPADYWLEDIEEFGEMPRPLPAINLYMAREEKRMKHTTKKISFRYVIDTEYFYKNYLYFADKIDDWKMKSQYLPMIMSHLISEKPDKEKMIDLLKQRMSKIPIAMVDKMMAAATNIYNSGFLNICYETESKWRLEWIDENGRRHEIENRPLITAMESHLVPVLNTADVIDEMWFKNIIADEMRYLQEYQKEHKKRLYLFIDELTTIYQMGERKDKASFELHRLFRQGRFNNIGFIINLQSYASLHQDIKDNLNYLFVGNIQNKEDSNSIRKNYDIPSTQMAQIENLKQFEFALFTKNPILAYNKFGQEVDVSSQRMFVGKTIAPGCRHLPPSRK